MAWLAWGLALCTALVWPGRVVTVFDGAPFDTSLELGVLAVVVPAIWWFHPRFLRSTAARVLIALLFAVKVGAWMLLPQGGWCADFVERQRPEIGGWALTRSWDARTFFESTPPSCSAIMAHAYTRSSMYPAWI